LFQEKKRKKKKEQRGKKGGGKKKINLDPGKEHVKGEGLPPGHWKGRAGKKGKKNSQQGKGMRQFYRRIGTREPTSVPEKATKHRGWCPNVKSRTEGIFLSRDRQRSKRREKGGGWEGRTIREARGAKQGPSNQIKKIAGHAAR